MVSCILAENILIDRHMVGEILSTDRQKSSWLCLSNWSVDQMSAGQVPVDQNGCRQNDFRRNEMEPKKRLAFKERLNEPRGNQYKPFFHSN
jgi:hypothetical protein